MKTMSSNSYILSVLLIAVWAFVAADPIQSTPVDAELNAAIDSNVHFSRQLLQVVGDSNSNMVMSPLSAQLALALTRLGARGQTANQISTALNIQQDQQPNFGRLMQLIQDQNDTTVRVVNRVYASDRATLREDFIRSVRNSLHADALTVTFGGSDTESAINNWVEEVTEGKIRNLVKQGSLDANTAIVLVNALYFKGNWDAPFSRLETLPFTISSEQNINIPFLKMVTTVQDDLRLAELPDLSARLLDIPYKGRKLRFVIVLPDKNSSLANLENAIATQDIRTLQNRARKVFQLKVDVPEITLDISNKLNQPLQNMGITNMFSNRNANFSGMFNENIPMYVTTVLQKTFLKLSLTGTEAASGTYARATFRVAMLRNPPVPFTADRPFLFFLVHNSADHGSTVLFSGRYVSP